MAASHGAARLAAAIPRMHGCSAHTLTVTHATRTCLLQPGPLTRTHASIPPPEPPLCPPRFLPPATHCARGARNADAELASCRRGLLPSAHRRHHRRRLCRRFARSQLSALNSAAAGQMGADAHKLEFEDFPGHTLTVLLLKDVTNSQ